MRLSYSIDDDIYTRRLCHNTVSPTVKRHRHASCRTEQYDGSRDAWVGGPYALRLFDWVCATHSNKWALDATLGGSGTLVTIDEVQGILSANHVIKLLRTNRDVGLVLPTASEELHHVSLRSSDFSDYSFCPEGKAENGPDLGLLVPPPDVLATLQARKSFYNISKRQDRMVEAPEPIERGLWVLSGFAGEQTGDRTPEQGFSKVKVFKGSHLAGKLASECKEGNFDYLFFEALYNDLYEGPDSYGGFSGGALWQLIVGLDGSRFRITDILLSGVAFYQSDKRDDGSGQVTRHIKCHGRRSLYKALIERVRAEHPQ
jgi:hypothetical protein